ncbi:MAG: hypothetical protein ABIH25_03745 [Candidatus Woesearchaeota archaeon]
MNLRYIITYDNGEEDQFFKIELPDRNNNIAPMQNDILDAVLKKEEIRGYYREYPNGFNSMKEHYKSIVPTKIRNVEVILSDKLS